MKIALLLGLALAVAAFCQTHSSTRDGVYTTEQAQRGKSSYQKACASCHGGALEGMGDAPPLTGADFIGDWNGRTVDDLFEKIQATMPADRPGQLARSENAGILAFILNANKFPAGKAELPSDAESLKQIRFEAPESN